MVSITYYQYNLFTCHTITYVVSNTWKLYDEYMAVSLYLMLNLDTWRFQCEYILWYSCTCVRKDKIYR